MGFTTPRVTGLPLEGTTAGARALLADAAVGLFSLSATALDNTDFFFGTGAGACASRALASEAAVGANKPDPGRTEELGVFALGVVVRGGWLGRDGVLARAAVVVLVLGTVFRAEDVVDVVD